MESISQSVFSGPARAPHRSLLHALGVGRDDLGKPLIGIANSYNELIPGHMHLNTIAQQVKYGVYQAGGIPLEFNVIGVCDGIAMNHEGMNYSLVSREVIADSVEIMGKAHGLDGTRAHPQLRQDHPRHGHGRGPARHPGGGGLGRTDARRRLPGPQGQPVADLRGRGQVLQGRDDVGRALRARGERLPDVRIVRRTVHGQLHELRDRGARPRPARRRHHPGSLLGAADPGAKDRRRGGRGRAQPHQRPHVPDSREHPQRAGRRRGSRLLHQHGAAPAGHRQRGSGRTQARDFQRDRRAARPTWSRSRPPVRTTWRTSIARAASWPS